MNKVDKIIINILLYIVEILSYYSKKVSSLEVGVIKREIKEVKDSE